MQRSLKNLPETPKLTKDKMKQLKITDGPKCNLRIHSAKGRAFPDNTIVWITEEPDDFQTGGEVGIVLTPAKLKRLHSWISERLEEVDPQEYNQF